MSDTEKIAWYKNKQLIAIGLFAGVLLAAVIISYLFTDKPPSAPAPDQPATGESSLDCPQRRLLDNVCVAAGFGNLTPWAVMIENNIEARPVAGIDAASLVFEAIAEGSITRFLAVFPGDSEVEKIGPVRSARPYYLDWATEFDPVYIHVGGSPQALAELADSSMKDLNQFYFGDYFWRSNDRFAPHNVYTSSQLINKVMEKKDWSGTSEYEPWQFKDETASADSTAEQNIVINYNSSYYDVNWQYDAESNEYVRYQSGKKYLTEAGDAVTAKNVAVVYTLVRVIDDYGRLDTKTIGQGRALVFRDGIGIDGQWKKQNAKSRLRFYDQAGEEIRMNGGKTWIAIVPDNLPLAEY
ncbi:MAG: DUF3048 domain-containing protein [Patescibacteria group bacterium]